MSILEVEDETSSKQSLSERFNEFLNMLVIRFLSASIVAGILTLGCSHKDVSVPPPANGGYLRAQGLKIIMSYHEQFGKWPKNSSDLTRAGLLPQTLEGDPNVKGSISVDDFNFIVLSAFDKNGQASIKFSINGETYIDENSLEALKTLR